MPAEKDTFVLKLHGSVMEKRFEATKLFNAISDINSRTVLMEVMSLQTSVGTIPNMKMNKGRRRRMFLRFKMSMLITERMLT